MSDSIFNELKDDVFIKNLKMVDENNAQNKHSINFSMDERDDLTIINDRVTKLTKIYMDSDASKENKLSFLKFKNEYLIIKNIENYKDIEKDLYKNKNRTQLVKFEISRILKNIDGNVKISDQIANIEKLLQVYDDNLSDELYYRIIKLIIRIELFLGMKIGLFNELCFLFETEMNEIEKSYSRKKSNGGLI